MSDADVLFSLIRGRRSIRRFKPDPVPEETIRRIIEVACWSPSAGNRQDWAFCVVTSPALKKQMADAVRAHWQGVIAAHKGSSLMEEMATYSSCFGDFERAPAVVIVSVRRVNLIQARLLGEDALVAAGGVSSAAMAAQTLMLAAHALALGSCCMTGAVGARAELGPMIGLNRKHEIVCLIALGWPDEAPEPPERKPIDEVARFLK